jgi:hypothetical protein
MTSRKEYYASRDASVVSVASVSILLFSSMESVGVSLPSLSAFLHDTTSSSLY